MVVIVRVGALVAALVLLGGCSGVGDGRDRDPANRPGYARGDSAESGLSRGPTAHSVRGSRAGIRRSAIFKLVNGASIVRVSVADLGGDLFRMSTPDDANVAPAVDVDGATVVAGLRGTGLAGPAIVAVVLSDDLRWDVRLAGGATDEAVDLTGGAGGNVDFTAGTSRAEVSLSAVRGTQRVTMSGGAGQFVVRLGGTAPVRVAATAGAGAVTVDGDVRSGVAGGTMWTQDGWDSATTRYDIDATAGVSTLTVERT
jgi:hypothetical protein